jgi:hypothetical protein
VQYKKEIDIYCTKQIKIFTMKNMRKLNKSDLRVIKGGIIPIGCNSWDPKVRCCRSWDAEHAGNPTCADSPPSFA